MSDRNETPRARRASPESVGLPAVIETESAVQRVVSGAEAGAFVLLGPASQFRIGRNTEVVVRVAHLDPKAHAYRLGNAQYALTRGALLDLAEIAGVQDVEIRRTDDRSDPDYAECIAVVARVLPDGQRIERRAIKAIDMREGSGQREATDRQKRQTAEVRKFIERHAASKAHNAALRAILGVRTYPSEAAVARPHVALSCRWVPRTPAEQMLAGAVAMGATAELFGVALRSLQGRGPAEAIDVVDDIDEPPAIAQGADILDADPWDTAGDDTDPRELLPAYLNDAAIEAFAAAGWGAKAVLDASTGWSGIEDARAALRELRARGGGRS